MVALAFQGEDAQQVAEGVGHIGAFGDGQPGATQNRRNNPITWSMRSPPAVAMLARSSSMKGS